MAGETGEKKPHICEVLFEPTDDATILKALEYKNIAVIGMSTNPEKASHAVGAYLRDNGFNVFPVHPTADEIAGLKAYPSLKDIPVQVDIVDIFRPQADVPPFVADAIETGAKVVWMQEGIVNHAAAETAEKAGLDVVMDRCIKKEHAALKRG
ncbi:MAG TPA: CoA-binding protein [bacterium]|nr:CoA-binding protein [bacterium]